MQADQPVLEAYRCVSKVVAVNNYIQYLSYTNVCSVDLKHPLLLFIGLHIALEAGS